MTLTDAKNYSLKNSAEAIIFASGEPVERARLIDALHEPYFTCTCGLWCFPSSKNRIETRLVLEAIADAEKIEISEEEMDAELQKMADQYQMELAKVKELFGDEEKKQLTQDLAVQKAITLLMDSAKEV